MAGITTFESFQQPLAPSIPWVAGRFYDCSLFGVGTNTATSKNNIYALPIRIPQWIVVTAIGVETTSAATAGSKGRLAIYDMFDDRWFPRNLIIDAGTISLDAAAAFQSIALSLPMQPGWYWLMLAQDNPATGATYRTHAGGAAIGHAFSSAVPDAPNTIGQIELIYASVGPLITTGGFPRAFPQYGFSMSTAAIPRLMLGV